MAFLLDIQTFFGRKCLWWKVESFGKAITLPFLPKSSSKLTTSSNILFRLQES